LWDGFFGKERIMKKITTVVLEVKEGQV